MDFIGRTSELATLNAELERGSGFVVIYGRRRVGKTTLIKEFIKDKRAFYFLATTESEVQSMKRFTGVLSRTTKNPMLSKVTFTDWLDLFQVVADDHPDEKKVLVIDEFPYLVKTNPDFPSILQNAWDEVLKDHNVMLVLCGSLISMMKKHALAYDSPLYGRRTAQIRLMPLQLRMCMRRRTCRLSRLWSSMPSRAAYRNIWSFSRRTSRWWSIFGVWYCRKMAFCMKNLISCSTRKCRRPSTISPC